MQAENDKVGTKFRLLRLLAGIMFRELESLTFSNAEAVEVLVAELFRSQYPDFAAEEIAIAASLLKEVAALE